MAAVNIAELVRYLRSSVGSIHFCLVTSIETLRGLYCTVPTALQCHLISPHQATRVTANMATMLWYCYALFSSQWKEYLY